MTVANLSQEFVGCRFGDARLTNRIKKLADQTAQKPNPSIPSALISKADIEGCYRFFDNDSVTPERILQPHIARTYQRMVEADLRTLKALLEGSQA